MAPAAPWSPPRRGRFPSPVGPLTAPSPRRRGAPAAGPSPSAAEAPTPGARARCGDARPVSHPRPGGGVTAAASAREDAAGQRARPVEPAHCPQGGQGTGWAWAVAAASKLPLAKQRLARGATGSYLSPPPSGPGARLRMPSAPFARTFPKSTPGFGSNRGDGGGGPDVRGGAGRKIKSREAGLGVGVGSERRRETNRDCVGYRLDCKWYRRLGRSHLSMFGGQCDPLGCLLRSSPPGSNSYFQANWSHKIEVASNRAYGVDGNFTIGYCAARKHVV